MQWDKQTEAALNGWFTAPQKAWENWWDVVAGSTQNGHATPSPAPILDYWNGIANQWLAAMQKSMEAYSPTLSDSARTAMAQFMMGQDHATHLLKMATDAWQGMMSNATSPTEWQAALDQYMTQLRQQLSSSVDGSKYLQNSTELWQLYNTEMQKFAQPWLAMSLQWPEQVSRFMSPHATTAAADNPLLTMANLYWDTYHQTLGRLVNMPSLGLMREFYEKVNRGFALWQENQQISFEYQVLLGDAFLNAFEAFMQRLLELTKSGKTIADQSELLELWVEVADEQYLAVFHSEHYANVQSQYVNSSMALRRQQRELLEILLRMNDLPTRSDLDEAHHNIFLLRKEVKALKKTLQELTEGTRPSPTATAAAVPTETATAKPATTVTPKSKKSTRSRNKTTNTSGGA